MVTIVLKGEVRRMEFREFVQWVRAGRVPDDAWISGDVLTGGEAVRAAELRTYAILRGRSLPPPRTFARSPTEPNIDTSLARISWQVEQDVSPAEPPVSAASNRLPAGWERTGVSPSALQDADDV